MEFYYSDMIEHMKKWKKKTTPVCKALTTIT